MSNLLYPSIYPAPAVSNITPFTYRDGITYLEKLEALTQYVIALSTEIDEILTDLSENTTNSYAQVFSYLAVTTSAPAVGKVYVDLWSLNATKIQLNETTDDGQNLTFALLDNSISSEIRLMTASGKLLRATITGDSVDVGAYREVPIKVLEVKGAALTTSEKVSVAIIVTL